MQLKNTLTNRKDLAIMIAAFAAVYIIWGSTYLAIKYAIETLPSFLMAGVRFTVAGAIMLAWARLSGNYERTTWPQWRTSLIVGTLLLGIGNGGVVYGEHYVSSSLTALLVATTPFWIVLFGWLFWGTARPNLKVVLGLTLGFAGVMLLILGGRGGGSSGGQWLGIAAILSASLGWSIGSLYGTRAPAASSAVQAAGMQMLAGGAVLFVMATFTGEWSAFDPGSVSAVSVLALAYLIVFGAVVAYTAYSWLMRNASPASVSTYAYVNPAIAVLLGWAIAGETMTGLMLAGAAVIVISVALITASKRPKDAEPGAAGGAEAEEAELHNSLTPKAGRKPLSASA